MHRRRVLTATAVGVVTALAGCGAVPDRIERDADPARVDPAVLEETGYEHETTDAIEVEDSISVAGDTVEYDVTNWSSVYSRTVSGTDSDEPFPGIVFLTTPDVRVANQIANPLGRIDTDDLARELAAELGVELDSLEEAGELSVDIAGETTTLLTRFESISEIDGESIETIQYVGRVVIEDDWLVFGAGYPAATDETDAIEAFAEGAVYPAETQDRDSDD